MNNLRIEYRRSGKLVAVREGHNTITQLGRQWLAEMVGLAAQDPDTPERSDRLRYLSVGVGGAQQTNPAAQTAPITTLYPAGFDPHATTGNEYDHKRPLTPEVQTLERPLKLLGSTTEPYPTAPGSDVWLFPVTTTHIGRMDTSVRATLPDDVNVLHLAGMFPTLPLSEVALHTSHPSVDQNAAYNPAVAYFSFDTLTKHADGEVEFIWSMRF